MCDAESRAALMPTGSRDLFPSSIVKYLDEHLIGQDSAKKALAVGIWNHYKRSFGGSKTPIQKSNIWLVGPSGTGKTAMANKIAQYLDVPFASIDASTITETGYIGEDPEIVIVKLLQAAEGNVEATQKGHCLHR
jgi:ATP-dependent Clp protease ATP-binding subunit ClpX